MVGLLEEDGGRSGEARAPSQGLSCPASAGCRGSPPALEPGLCPRHSETLTEPLTSEDSGLRVIAKEGGGLSESCEHVQAS